MSEKTKTTTCKVCHRALYVEHGPICPSCKPKDEPKDGPAPEKPAK